MNGLPVTICLIASIVVCYGTGNWRTGSYLAGALPLRLIQLRRNARRRQFRFHYFPNPLLFDSPPSTAAGPFFRLCPELAAQTERRLRWAIGSPLPPDTSISFSFFHCLRPSCSTVMGFPAHCSSCCWPFRHLNRCAGCPGVSSWQRNAAAPHFQPGPTRAKRSPENGKLSWRPIRARRCGSTNRNAATGSFNSTAILRPPRSLWNWR